MILAALAVLIIVAAVNSGKNRYTDELDSLKDKWGKLGDTQYPSDDFENITRPVSASINIAECAEICGAASAAAPQNISINRVKITAKSFFTQSPPKKSVTEQYYGLFYAEPFGIIRYDMYYIMYSLL